jgi:hypothetical protein
MMKLICSKCGADVPLKDVDVASERACCPNCGNFWDCREWIQSHFKGEDKLTHPPAGVTYHKTPQGFAVAASARSGRWIFWIPFALIATRIMYVFVYALFFAKPSPGRPVDAWNLNLFRLFLTPFLLGTLAAWFAALMSICGKVVFSVEGDSATIFRGIGFLGWRRRLNWSDVTRVRLGKMYAKNSTREQIVLEGHHPITFARGVSHERLLFLMTALSTHCLRGSDSKTVRGLI